MNKTNTTEKIGEIFQIEQAAKLKKAGHTITLEPTNPHTGNPLDIYVKETNTYYELKMFESVSSWDKVTRKINDDIAFQLQGVTSKGHNAVAVLDLRRTTLSYDEIVQKLSEFTPKKPNHFTEIKLITKEGEVTRKI